MSHWQTQAQVDNQTKIRWFHESNSGQEPLEYIYSPIEPKVKMCALKWCYVLYEAQVQI
jgi:hypothetical protein